MGKRVNETRGLSAGHDGGGQGTRRAFLAAGSALALGALAGCSAIDGLLEEAGEQAVGATTASPAAFYAGHARPGGSADSSDEPLSVYESGPADVRYVPATVRGGGQQVDLEGWATSESTKAQDYNSSRSNRPRSLWRGDTDDDSDTDVLVRLLDVERALAIQVAAALDTLTDRSKTDSQAALKRVLTTIEDVRAELDAESENGCTTEVCAALRKHADARKSKTQAAIEAVQAGDWKQATASVQTVQQIVDGDVEQIWDDLDSDGDGLMDATEAQYEYLDGEPTIGEHFAVSLPAASLPGDRGALADELTPRRLLAYLTGERDRDGCVETDSAVVIHRDIACRNLLATRLDEQGPDRRKVLAFEADGGVVVTGASPDAEGATDVLRVSDDGTASEPSDLDSWGTERQSGEAAVTPTLVLPVAATPADCACPLPALLYLRRINHDDQYIYAGGWLLDDGALYEDAATLLVAEGSPQVVGVAAADVESGDTDLRALVERRKRPGRKKYGNITLQALYDPDADYLPAGANSTCAKKGYDYWQAQSREALVRGGGDCDDSDYIRPPASLVSALDAPIMHLVEAAEASKEVKFKAGAELSKSVN